MSTALHNPVRGAGETQAEYRSRQARSKAAVLIATKGPRQAPARSELDTSRFFLGQHTNRTNAPRRAMLDALGRRQTLKRIKAIRRHEREQ